MREEWYDEGLPVADALIMLVPRSATAYKLRGWIHVGAHRNLKALADFETAAELGPGDPETHWRIGTVCRELGEYEKAIKAYEETIELKPPDEELVFLCHYYIGESFRNTGKFEEALASYEEAKKLGVYPVICDVGIAKCRAQMKGDSGTRENEASRKEAERKRQLSDEACAVAGVDPG